MSVKLRLMRMGKKKQPSYRVVAADTRKARNGRFIEILGIYQPREEPSVVRIDNEKALAWLRNGAQPTETVEKLLKISGAWQEFTGEEITVTPPPPKPAPAPAPAPAAAPEPEPAATASDEPAPEPAAPEAAEGPAPQGPDTDAPSEDDQ